MESHLEARLWNDVFTFAEDELGIAPGTIRATVLIETIPAAFEMEEILYELRDHASGLNAGRWDYLFSIIKYFRDAGPEFVLVDRADITMTAPFMRAYTELLVKTCHRRGAFAMGGMAAFIPSRKDAEINACRLRQGERRQDPRGRGRLRRLLGRPPRPGAGLPGGLRRRASATGPTRSTGSATRSQVSGPELLDVASARGGNTETGLRNNLYVAVAYTAVWLSGNGAVGDPQPDGGRRHRRDLPIPGLAADPQRGGALRHRTRPSPGSWSPGCSTRRSTGSADEVEPNGSSATTCRPRQLIADLCLERRLHRLPDPARVRAG